MRRFNPLGVKRARPRASDRGGGEKRERKNWTIKEDKVGPSRVLVPIISRERGIVS